MSTFELTPPTEAELMVQSVVSAVQALDKLSTDDLRAEADNLLYAAAKLNGILNAIDPAIGMAA